MLALPRLLLLCDLTIRTFNGVCWLLLYDVLQQEEGQTSDCARLRMVAHYEPQEEDVAPPAGGALEPDDDRWRQQEYTPLDMVDGDPIFLMRAPDAAGVSDDEYDSDSDGREDVEPAAGTGTFDFRTVTDALLASMEDDYRRTVEAGRRPAAGDGMGATDAATGSVAAAATEGRDLEGVAIRDDVWRPCAVEGGGEGPSSSPPSAPPEAPLSQEKEEEIKTIMTGVTLSQSAVPGWAEGLAWDNPDIQELLKSLQK